MNNREIDKLVAEKVMGYDFKSEENQNRHPEWVAANYYKKPGGEYGILPKYSTDISAAWEVLLEANRRLSGPSDASVRLVQGEMVNHWECRLESSELSVKAREQSAPEAICKAALKAVGVDA